MNSWILRLAIIGVAVSLAQSTDADACQWVSPYDGTTYSNVQLVNHGNGTLSNPWIVLDFWSFQAGTSSSVQTVLADQLFWQPIALSTSSSAIGTYRATYNFTHSSGTIVDLYGEGINGNPLSSMQQNIESDIQAGMPAGQGGPWGDVIVVVFVAPNQCSSTCFNCFQSCDSATSGYHRYYYSPQLGRNVPYAVINYQNTNGQSMLAAHEIMEAATNPTINGWYSDHPTASELTNSSGSGVTPEIGDLCNGQPAFFGPQATQAMGQQSWFESQCRCNYEYGLEAAGGTSGCGEIASSWELRRGQYLNSCQNGYQLWMQNDGNLVLYNHNGTAIWGSGTNGWGAGGQGGNVVMMQNDGNFVVYDNNMNWMWQTYTYNNPGAVFWDQNDGNLVVYSGSGTALWASGTTGR